MTATQIKQFVEVNFTVVKERYGGDELAFICPQPGCQDHTGNRSVNLKSQKTSCFRCNIGGSFSAWVARLGYDIGEGDKTVSTTMELLEMLDKKTESTIVKPVNVKVKLPKGSIRLNHGSAYVKAIERMAIKKHLSLDDMLNADVHVNYTNPQWDSYAIFPVYEWGKLVFYQGRLIAANEGMLPKRNPSRMAVPFGAKFWAYNIDEARRPEVEIVIVLESILNVLSLRKKIHELGIPNVAPVCVFKHYLSRPQAVKILECSNIKEVCFLYDADATADAWRQSVNMVNNVNCTVAQMLWTAERPTLDANDDVDLAWDAILKRLPASMSESILVSCSERHAYNEAPRR